MRRAIWGLFALFGAVCAWAQAPGSQPFALPECGRVHLKVPADWKESAGGVPPPNQFMRTIRFGAAGGKQFSALITTICPPPGRPMFSPAGLRPLVEKGLEAARPKIQEAQVELRELKQGDALIGYYYTGTDRAPKAGEFKFMASGSVISGAIILSFSIFTNDDQESVVQQGLELIRTAVHESRPSSEKTEVGMPGADWRIGFTSPPLGQKSDSKTAAGYAYKANAGRFNLSLFIEEPRGGATHKECFEHYWASGQKNPLNIASSIRVSETPQYVKVQYDQSINFQGRALMMRHVNYYFAHRGKWVDVHVSIIVPGPATELASEDAAILKTFEESLTYGA